MTTSLPAIVVTSGEPAGIGPDLCAKLAAEKFAARLVVLGDRKLIESRAAAQGVALGALDIEHMPLAGPCVAGKLSVVNARYVLKLLDRAVSGCARGEFAAMVTAPVQKSIINDAALLAPETFMGHTEYLAAKTHTPHVVMMLVGGGLRVALATTHLSLRDVPAAITRPMLTDTLRILHNDLQRKFGIGTPRILVAGLNPHAGESGHLGREELDVITPVIERLRREGMNLTGPLPADTLFTPRHLGKADAVLAMYHDQGLSVLKYASFGTGVNVTLGLPVVRTSVDHGTALDLAGHPGIDARSMIAAVELAIELTQRAGLRIQD